MTRSTSPVFNFSRASDAVPAVSTRNPAATIVRARGRRKISSSSTRRIFLFIAPPPTRRTGSAEIQPGPSSSTVIRTPPSRSESRTRTFPSRSGDASTAFFTMFVRTCLTRTPSTSAVQGSAGASSATETPLRFVSSSIPEQAGAHLDRSQRSADLVCDARGHLPEGCQFLALDHLVLHRLELGQVLERSDETGRSSAPVGDPRRGDEPRRLRAVAPHDVRLPAPMAVAIRGPSDDPLLFPVRGVPDEELEILPDHGAFRPAKQAACPLVHRGDRPLRVERDDSVVDAVHDARQKPLPGADLLLLVGDRLPRGRQILLHLAERRDERLRVRQRDREHVP